MAAIASFKHLEQCNVFGSDLVMIFKSTAQYEQAFHSLDTIIIPNVCHCIKAMQTDKFDFIPDLIGIICEKFGEEGLNMIENRIFPCFLESYLKSGSSIKIVLNVIVASAMIIPESYRHFLVDLIQSSSESNDCRLRILSLFVMPVLSAEESNISMEILYSLIGDRVPSVRVALIENLSLIKIEQSQKNIFLSKGLADYTSQVRNSVASLYAKISPSSIDGFLDVFKDSRTQLASLLSAPEMIRLHGYSKIKETFTEALKTYPSEGINALLEVSKNLLFLSDDDQQLIFETAKMMENNTDFLRQLFLFAEKFTAKSKFIYYFQKVDNVNMKWRQKYWLLKQCILFIDYFEKKDVISLGFSFSNDETAIIRNNSVELWAKIFNLFPENVNEFCEALLYAENWQKRMILVKVIELIGMRDTFETFAETLANDKISNVRLGFAKAIAHTQFFSKLFQTTSDDDIKELNT